MLISTLVTLMLLIGLTLTLQAQTLASTKIAKRLAAVQAEALAGDAVRVLVQPVIGEAMLRFEAPPVVLGREPFTAGFGGWGFVVETEVTGPEWFAPGNGEQPREVRVGVRAARGR